MNKLLVGIFVALVSFNVHASGYWPDPWSEEFPDPCIGSFASSPYCSLDPDPLHCSWYYPGATNHPLCQGRPQFPRVCEIRRTCIGEEDPIPPNPCDTEPAWCQGPTYRPANVEIPNSSFYVPPPLPPADLLVVEYIKTTGSVRYYFLTANVEEMAVLDVVGSGWRRTGETFMAWSKWNDYASPVQRFYNNKDHYYTIDTQAISAIRFTNRFYDEGVAFWAVRLTPFGCPNGTNSVDIVTNEFVRRWVADAELTEQLILRTPVWYYGGEVFCVQ